MLNVNSPYVTLNNQRTPTKNEMKYLNLKLDKYLTWITYIKFEHKTQTVNYKLHLLRLLLKS